MYTAFWMWFSDVTQKKRGRIEDVIWGLRRILVSLIILLMTLNKATITRVRLTEIIT